MASPFPPPSPAPTTPTPPATIHHAGGLPPPSGQVSGPAVAITNPIPAPKVKKWSIGALFGADDERNQLEKDGSQSHNIRRIAAYGALLLATLMYGSALVVLGAMLGFIETPNKKVNFEWHELATMLVPLFTVPTVLLIGVLRMTSRTQEEVPKSAQEALGQMVQKIFDKLTD